MSRSLRLIVTIDQDKCSGCGRCVKACLTGALQIIDGKAKLVDERRCDGFGSCIAVCQNNAIRLELREAEDFDWTIVNEITYENLMKKLTMTSTLSI